MGRNIESKSFASIWKEVKSYTCTVNETETFEMLLLVMAGRGFKFTKHEFIILSTRGQMRSQKIERISQNKRFFYNSVEEKMKSVFHNLKDIHNKSENLNAFRLYSGRDTIRSRLHERLSFKNAWDDLVNFNLTLDEIDAYECFIFLIRDVIRDIKITDAGIAFLNSEIIRSLQKKKIMREYHSIPFSLDSVKEELNTAYEIITRKVKYDKL
ncbi:hypothetical protein FKC56_23885 [Salmonella enterica]|nr:hypothetical protein [Salmonella enterica]ECS5904834.1 hypothetical protein [Salmonella enterica subsp. enterica serovar Reading]